MRVLGARPGTLVADPGRPPATLESAQLGSASPPRMAPAQVIEAGGIHALRVHQAPAAEFAAFLDGIQRSVVVGHFGSTIPVVHGTVAAAIRVRSDRVLRTWGSGPRIDRALFLPVALVSQGAVNDLSDAGFAIVDTTPDGGQSGHPHELLGHARQAIQQKREDNEAALAREWCSSEQRALYVDGGISAFGEASRSPAPVGVIKSHHTLYVDPAAVQIVVSLAPGERTTAFAVATRLRTRVASWYLRLRAGDGIDPFAGIVRIEVCEGGFSPGRADLVSAWVLAEREPVALPDPRWRAMAYGVRDCERYLRAVAG